MFVSQETRYSFFLQNKINALIVPTMRSITANMVKVKNQKKPKNKQQQQHEIKTKTQIVT